MFKPYAFDTAVPVDEDGRILLKAADLIREGGLAKHVRFNGTSHCIHGALDAAISGSPDTYNELAHPAFRRARSAAAALGFIPQGHTGYLAEWNNQPERTADDVIYLLEAAARRPVPA